MVHIRHIRSRDLLEVTFELDEPDATEAYVAVGGRGWDRVPLRRYPPGSRHLRATLRLPGADEVEFRYLVDGRWRNDPNVAATRPNGLGDDNSLVVVDA